MNQLLFFVFCRTVNLNVGQGKISVREQELARRVQALVNEDYDEPIIGNFPHVTSTVLADLHTSSESETKDEEEQ